MGFSPFSVHNYRRCIQCSSLHCCNSWCKEEAVVVCLYLALTASQAPSYLAVLADLADRLGIDKATEAINMAKTVYVVG